MKFSTFAVSQMFNNRDFEPLVVTAFSFTENAGYKVTYATYDKHEPKCEPTYNFADANLQDLLDGLVVECHTTNTAFIFTTNDPQLVLEAWDDVKDMFDDYDKPYRLMLIDSHTFVLS